MSTSRETARDALVTLLETALVGTGLPCKTVTGSKVTSLAGLTPLVSVLSGGSDRPRMTFQGNRAIFQFEIQIWVMQATTGWTNAQAEDALDSIEAIIAGVYESARGTDEWEIIEYASPTSIIEINASGQAYYLERIPTRVLLTRS